jgi:signal transduction histidine kinase
MAGARTAAARGGTQGEEPRSILQIELEPERVRRNLTTGTIVFRVFTYLWMLVFNLAMDGFARPWLAYASLALAGGWTAFLAWRPSNQSRPWALWADLGISTYLVLVSAYVMTRECVVGCETLFFATAYPVTTPLVWGMTRGPAGGFFAAAVLTVALLLTRPLNGVAYDTASVFNTLNGGVYYFIAGWTMGVIERALTRSSEAVREAVAIALDEQRRAGGLAVRARLAADIHDSVLNKLGFLRAALRADAGRGNGSSESGRLADTAEEAERDLRDLIQSEVDQVPEGMIPLKDALHQVRRRVTGLHVEVSCVGGITLPTRVASEISAAVLQALQNVAKHASTDRAFVFAEIDAGVLAVSVRDAGVGYHVDPGALERGERYGMRGMRARIDALGGRMKSTSAPGLGTTVEFLVPAEPAWTGGRP